MKLIIMSVLLCFCHNAFSDNCTASPSNCVTSCTAVSTPGGSVDCYDDMEFAQCSSFNSDGDQVDFEEVWCGGGGSGGSGSGGGGPQYCSMYWWLCDPWSV